MGTRADFYVRDEWLGSIAFDGYPDGQPARVLSATSESEFRLKVASLLTDCDSATFPEQGWPWPWRDSATTDYAYRWGRTRVMYSCFGKRWTDAKTGKQKGRKPIFPDMTDRQNVTFGKRSGILLIGMPK